MTVKDIVRDVIERLMAHDDSITQELALRIEREVRADWGGQRVIISKSLHQTKTHGRPTKLDDKAAREAYADGLTNMPTEEITRRRGISRATLYRLMKKGPPPVGST